MTGVVFRQRFTPAMGNLEMLACGEYEVPPGAASQEFSLAGEECLLFEWKGESTVSLAGSSYLLRHYDVLYVPRGTGFSFSNPGSETAHVIQISAPAENVHPVCHRQFAELSQQEDRIRRLKGKDVYLMFDVGEQADKLIAGYTFFQPFQRTWPPHNHTDQEEVYIALKGSAAMEVYGTVETTNFVHTMNEGDMVTVPLLNYHPVFSQAEPFEFLWCIAGARYWVGDKHKQLLTGAGDPITT
jgi:mannose-6-phosphate isomerase-like protein (cupin superfamily)